MTDKLLKGLCIFVFFSVIPLKMVEVGRFFQLCARKIENGI